MQCERTKRINNLNLSSHKHLHRWTIPKERDWNRARECILWKNWRVWQGRNGNSSNYTPIENQHLPNDKNRKIYHPYCSRSRTHLVPLIFLTIHSDKIEGTKCGSHTENGLKREGKKPTNTKTCTQRTTKNILKATITPLIVIPHKRTHLLSTHVAFCMQKF